MDDRNGYIYTHEEASAMSVADQAHMRPMEHYPTPIQRARGRVGRNDPCPCGSRKKFKKCCLFGGVGSQG